MFNTAAFLKTPNKSDLWLAESTDVEPTETESNLH